MTKEEAINTLARFKTYISGGGVVDKTANEAIKMAIEALDNQKTGRWRIYFIAPYGEGCSCSECGCEGAPNWNYCSNCGSKMESVEVWKDD